MQQAYVKSSEQCSRLPKAKLYPGFSQAARGREKQQAGKDCFCFGWEAYILEDLRVLVRPLRVFFGCKASNHLTLFQRNMEGDAGGALAGRAYAPMPQVAQVWR